MRDEDRSRTDAKQVQRREFLAAGLVAGLAPKVAQGGRQVEAQQTAPRLAAGTIPVRRFGKTRRTLPILGYGGAAIPRVWFNPLSTEDRVKLVRYAFDRGIRYFDTAGNYMESQPILGEALKGVRREVYLVTKVETTNPERVRGAVEKSLKQLQTDYLDSVLIHGTPGIEDMSVAAALKIRRELVKLRDERILKFIGLSAHGYFDKALALISSGCFDQCMLSYGYLPRGHNQVHSARMLALRDACLAKAHELGMGIVAMKVIGAGLLGAWSGYVVPSFDKQRLAHLPEAAIRYVLLDPRIHVLNIGMRLRSEIDANLGILTSDTTYTHEDRALLAEFSAQLFDTDAIKKLRIE